MAGQILHRYFVIIVQILLLLAVGILAFKIRINGNYFWFWLVMTFGALCFLSIGFALTILIRSARSATPICMTVYFLLMFLGGLFFPINIMLLLELTDNGVHGESAKFNQSIPTTLNSFVIRVFEQK